MYIAQFIDNLSWGGAQKMQITLARAMRERNVRLKVITLRNSPHAPYTADLQALGVPVVTFPGHGLKDVARIGRIVRFLHRERFDVLHTHLGYANVIGTLAGRLVGLPVIGSLRSAGFEHRDKVPYLWALETWALRYGVQRVMAVGHLVAEVHRERLRGKLIDVIPNAVAIVPPLPEAERNSLRAEMTGDPTRPLLISVGRLSPAKGYPDLLTAFATLRKTHPSAALVIVGGGSLRPELESRIADLSLEGHAILLGPREDVPRLLAASDIYVSSSHWEGLPVSVLEAMGAGLPIVATQVGDIPNVVVAGTGQIVPPHEPMLLARVLGGLLDNPAQRNALGAAARAHILQNHSLSAWADQILALYAKVCASSDLVSETCLERKNEWAQEPE
jgi:glycosyltransferase involved in cell wall biosynthesis